MEACIPWLLSVLHRLNNKQTNKPTFTCIAPTGLHHFLNTLWYLKGEMEKRGPRNETKEEEEEEETDDDDDDDSRNVRLAHTLNLTARSRTESSQFLPGSIPRLFYNRRERSDALRENVGLRILKVSWKDVGYYTCEQKKKKQQIII